MPVINTWRDLERLALRAEPRVKRALLEAIRRLRGSMTAAQALEGRIPPQLLSRSLRGLQAQLTTLAVAAARFNIERYLRPGSPLLNTGVSLPGVRKLSFTIVNPAAVEAAATKEVADLVKAVGNEIKAGIRAATKRGIAQGIPVRSSARMIRDQVGLGPWQVRALNRQRDALINRGITGARLEARMATLSKRALIYRSETIMRTETIRAVNIGQDAVWREMQTRRNAGPGRKVTYKRRWVVTPDSRLCPVCSPMHNQERKIGELFVSSYNGASKEYPPMHPRCRCALGLVVPVGDSRRR